MSKEFNRHELVPNLWLDGRRAVWLAEEQALAVADLHLGYIWAQRQAGMLLPLSAPDDTVDRLIALQECYQPKQLLLLGDIVHRALNLPAIASELQRLVQALAPFCQLRFIAGNHDRNLAELLRKLNLACPLESQARVGPHLLLHGDDCEDNRPLEGTDRPPGFTIIGHEHPAIWVGDGVANSAKCPCFLAGNRVLVLPAFSQWAAGVSISGGRFMSRIARDESFTKAIAVMNEHLLPIGLGRASRFP